MGATTVKRLSEKATIDRSRWINYSKEKVPWVMSTDLPALHWP